MATLQTNQIVSRRDLLKTAALATGAVVVSSETVLAAGPGACCGTLHTARRRGTGNVSAIGSLRLTQLTPLVAVPVRRHSDSYRADARA